MLLANLSEATPIRLTAADGNTGLFPQVKVIDLAGSTVATLTLTHITGGTYGVSYTPGVEGTFTLRGQFFTDAPHTVDAGYLLSSDDLVVSAQKLNIARLLGLSNENNFIDQQVYSGANLVSARLRTYDTKAHALAGGSLGVIASYTMSAGYAGLQLTSYTMVRDS